MAHRKMIANLKYVIWCWDCVVTLLVACYWNGNRDVKCELNQIEMYTTIQRKLIQYLLHTVHKVDITVGKLFELLTKSVENWDKLLKNNICSGWFEVFTIRARNKLLKKLQRVWHTNALMRRDDEKCVLQGEIRMTTFSPFFRIVFLYIL